MTMETKTAAEKTQQSAPQPAPQPETPSHGGSYVVDEHGQRTLVEQTKEKE